MKQTVVLPGGLEIDGALYREAVFKAITGHIEQTIEDIRLGNLSRSTIVTNTLTVCLERLGNKTANKALVESLGIADRQFLMLCLSVRLYRRHLWMHPICKKCGAKFDIFIDKLQLPVAPASGNYPYSTILINDKSVSLRAPTGRDQAELINLNGDQAIQHILRSCINRVDGQEPDEAFFNSLNENNIEMIELALEEISPSVCSNADTECPECGSNQTVELNLSILSGNKSANHLMMDIHRLASHYHWSEHEILSLPKIRRQVYLDYIDASEGMYS